MKIVYLTAGAAGMYCGSCMHDNSLAKALIQLGADCLLVPVYTPIRTDESDISVDRVFFGGINIYLQQKMPWLAYLPRWIDAMLSRPNLIRRMTAGSMTTDPKFLGALTVSMLRGMDGNQRKEVLRLCDWLSSDVQPDVLVLTNMLIAGCIPEFKRRFDRPVFVTLQGDDIFFDFLPEPYREQSLAAMRKLVPVIDGFLVHSHDYGMRMGEILAIPPRKIHVTPLGIDLTDFRTLSHKVSSDYLMSSSRSVWSSRSAKDGQPSDHPPKPIPSHPTLTIGYLARMAPEKGLHLLVDAFIELTKRPGMDQVRLLMAGWMGPQHQEFWSQQRTKLTAAGLTDRWQYLGSVDRQGKIDFLSSIDLICVPTTYREPKGLSILEAVACGVPYLQPAHGAFPEMHARLSHGDLFAPNDPAALCQSLAEMLSTLVVPIQRDSRRHQLFTEIDIATMADRTLKILGQELIVS